MIINYKAALITEQIYDRILPEKGNVKDLEIQVLSEFDVFPGMSASEILPKEIKKDIQNKKYTINVVHTPLYNGNESNLDDIALMHLFDKTCQLAQCIASIQKNTVIVVIHLQASVERLKTNGTFTGLKSHVLQILAENPNIEIAIENSTAFDYEPGRSLQLNDVFILENNNIKLSCLELVKEINSPRCGVCIDFCHLIMTQRFLDALVKYFNDKSFKIDIVENVFKMVPKYIKLIHLSYASGHGYKELHGMAFDEEDEEAMKQFRKFMRLYKKYIPKTPITIETTENDYTDAQNCVKVFNLLSK